MAIPELKIIGESINDSLPSTRRLYEENNIDGMVLLARTQDENGAAYIDVNVGRRPPSFMADMVRRIQQATAKPLSIDTPDPEIAAAGLEAYAPDRAGGSPPILNSISPLRLELFDLYRIRPFIPILMVSERREGSSSAPNRTAAQTGSAARQMLSICRERIPDFTNHNAIIDPGIAPIGCDMEGGLKRLLAAMAIIQGDPLCAGVHLSVGLSNFTVMLPPRCADGSPVRGPLESALLTLAMPLGLDMIIGSTTRKYFLLAEDHPAIMCLRDVLGRDGYEAVERVMQFYS